MKSKFSNVKIKKPKTDQCNTCEMAYLVNAVANLHKERADRLREQQVSDKKQPNCFTFDLQQVQPLPDLLVNKAFYSRKMWIYNLGINFTKKNQGIMHLWLESEGKRGSIEITSCIYKSLTEMQTHNPQKEWIIWSDSCGGQNRNIRMTTFLLRLVHDSKLGIEKIIHRFPEPGHSLLPNDQDFGVIDSAKKLNRPIYSMEKYEEIITGARSKPSQFVIVRMKTEDFKDFGVSSTNFQNLAQLVDSNGEKFTWLHIKEFVYQREVYGFFFRYDLNEELRLCNLGNPGGRSRRPKEPSFKTAIQAYNQNGISMKKMKWLDIQKLLEFIPPIHHKFFKDLPHEGNEDDIDEYYPDEMMEVELNEE